MYESQGEVVLILITSTVLILLLATIVVVALLIQNKRKYKHRQQLSEIKIQHEKILLETKLKILEDTFKAISQNLHDNVGSNISTAMLLLYKDGHIDMTEQDQNRKEAINILDKVVDDLKNIAHSLNPDYLDEIGLSEAIKQRVDQLKKTRRYKIALKCNDAPQRLNRQKQLILFYVFQEAMNNINNHAAAKNVDVILDYDPSRLVMRINDDGKGMDVQQVTGRRSKGTGLLNMKSHAVMIEAALDIKSATGAGTQIVLSVPDPY
jgi:two-component system, NarL family, sensor kinase